MHSELDIASRIAEHLLSVEAVRLRPDDPFTWASGIQSPIYCDNRLLLSEVGARRELHDAMARAVQTKFSDAQAVAGVATAGIPHAAVIAHELNLPLIYIRSKAKGHGRQNLIEGQLDTSRKYVVVEDLISTGGSVLQAVDALQEAGAAVSGVLAIFTYGFHKAKTAFEKAQCPFHTLSDIDALLTQALRSGYIEEAQSKAILSWRKKMDA